MAFDVHDPEYKYTAFVMTLEKSISLEELRAVDKDLTHEKLAKWALEEISAGVNKKFPYFPTDETSVRRMYAFVTEAVPIINGGSREYVEEIFQTYQELTKKYSPLVAIHGLDIKFPNFKKNKRKLILPQANLKLWVSDDPRTTCVGTSKVANKKTTRDLCA